MEVAARSLQTRINTLRNQVNAMKAPVALEFIGKCKYNEENDLHPEETDIVTSQEGSSKFRLSVNPSSQLASHLC